MFDHVKREYGRISVNSQGLVTEKLLTHVCKCVVNAVTCLDVLTFAQNVTKPNQRLFVEPSNIVFALKVNTTLFVLIVLFIIVIRVCWFYNPIH